MTSESRNVIYGKVPFSNHETSPTVLHFAKAVAPQRILDIGVGLGLYGLQLRVSLDIAQERMKREHWKTRLEGLEIFPGYRNPLWDYAYDEVHIGDARDLKFEPDSFDLVLINDVLEHLEQKEALACVKKALELAPVVIVTSPVSHIEQGAWGGNPHETHRSVVEPSDLPGVVCIKYCGLTFCCVCCRDAEHAAAMTWAAGPAPVSRPELIPYAQYRALRKLRTLKRKFLGG